MENILELTKENIQQVVDASMEQVIVIGVLGEPKP